MNESRAFEKLADLDARELNELGNACLDCGMWEKALECYERSLSLRREAEDRRGEMVALNNLGALCHRQGLWEEALGYYHQSCHLAQELGEGASELATLMNIAFIHFTCGRSEEFFLLADEAEELAQALEEWVHLSTLHWLQGRQALTSSRGEEGMAHYAEALRFALKGGEATLGEMLAYVDKEIEWLVAQDFSGLALVFCDYLLVACEGMEGVRHHLAGKREGELGPGWKSVCSYQLPSREYANGGHGDSGDHAPGADGSKNKYFKVGQVSGEGYAEEREKENQ